MTHQDILYDAVIQSGLIIPLIICTVIFVISLLTRSKELIIGAFFISFCIMICEIPVTIYNAKQAVGADWQQKIDENTTYFERLHGFWVDYDIITHTCHDKDNDTNTNNTGCKYVTVTSYCASKDDEGDCDDTDYEFDTWFDYELSYTGDLNIYKRGHVVFGSHYAPPDWKKHKNHYPLWGADFNSDIPADFTLVQKAIDAGEVLPGTVLNTYMHYYYADDFTILKTHSASIGNYPGLLPTINPVYNSKGEQASINIQGDVSNHGFQYDAVQFLQVTISPEEKTRWNNIAHLWLGMAGPQIESDMIMFFAPANQIGNPYDWIMAAKAWLSTEESENGGFGRYILPKNTVLIGCGLDDAVQTIVWCQSETGMFIGNEQFIQDIRRLGSIPFTPEAVFGIFSAKFASDANGYVMSKPEEDPDSKRHKSLMVPEVSFSGGIIDGVIRDQRPNHGYHRVPMDQFKLNRLSLEPTAEQINDIKNYRSSISVIIAVGLWVVIIALIVYASTRR